jgi:hypothetical protein
VVWWTNIRFEKSFTLDLCLLLKESGCIAISGGLEVASDRLLAMIVKGVTIAQVTEVCRNFTQSGIMVHAYLMYGFPTQTAQETIDSLEVVRQLFMNGVLQSGFWHQFAMTAHSPVGLNPELFKVKRADAIHGSFANNDLMHVDRIGGDHEAFSEGLKKSLFNYMHGIGFDFSLDKWFDFKVPRTKISPDLIQNILSQEENNHLKPGAKLVWLGSNPSLRLFTKSKKGKDIPMAALSFTNKKSDLKLELKEDLGKWLNEILARLSVNNEKIYTLSEVEQDFKEQGLGSFENFWNSDPMHELKEHGLLVL